MAKTILIAEDFADDAALLQQMLKSVGVHNPVMTVGDGEQAIAYLKGEGQFSDRLAFPLPAVLLLDLKMPRTDGFKVLEWLANQPELKQLLVIVVSGSDAIKDVQMAYKLGAHSFLTKPFTPDDVKNLTNAFEGYWQSSA